MTKTTINVLMVLFIVFAYSCGGHSGSGEELRDNDGKPWEANPETTTGVNNMIRIMGEFSAKDDLASYTELSEGLKNEFGMIFKNCTMTGEAHNQLHSFLLPMNDLFDGIGSADLVKCKENYNNLNTHLKMYNKYFK